MRKLLFGICFALTAAMVPGQAYAQVNYGNEANESEAKEIEYYEGKVTRGVNVRKKAGADQEKVTYKGEGVTLSEGTIVTIVKTVNVGDKPWYKIIFTYKGKEMKGYSTSSYITKTGNIITPTPLPDPTATIAPTPTITPEPTKALEVTQAPEQTQTNDSKGNKSAVLWVVGILAVLAASGGAYYYFIMRPKQSSENTKEVSEKITKLKNMVLTKDTEKQQDKQQEKQPEKQQDKQQSATQNKSQKKHGKASKEITKKPGEVLVYKGDKIVPMEELKQGNDQVYVKTQEEDEFGSLVNLLDEPKSENDSQSKNTKEPSALESKRALQIAVNKLREHDIIIHKYFGRGEVFDNSDVKLIEVRFGPDTRFLNKEQLVNKKLIEITNETNR